MPLKIISADERLAERRSINGVILGPSGVGKTSLLYSLDEATTLFVDYEAGDLAVQNWGGDAIRPRTWPESRDLACWLGGPNPALAPDQPYSQAHFEHVLQAYGDRNQLSKYETIFVDSITDASRLAFTWAKTQPEARNQQGKPDTRGAYGLLGQEMIGWLKQLKHIRDRNIWMVGILDRKTDDFNRVVWEPQIEGGKTGRELEGIVDEVITMQFVADEAGALRRSFVCHKGNEFGYPAKDRSGRLDMLEEPHLGRLMDKIRGAAKPVAERFVYGGPPAAA